MSQKPAKKSIAAALGVSPQRITALARQGMPTDTLAHARAWYSENVRERSKPVDHQPGHEPDTIAHARLREARARAERFEMDNAARAGQLTDKAGVERAAYACGRILQKTLVDVMPSKLALELSAMTDPWQIECFLRDQVRAELAAIAGMTPAQLSEAAL